MADNKQFGSPRTFGDKAAGNQSGDSGHCARCEAMLADALDGTLSAADQEFFDLHMALCAPCTQQLADARRGAAWLEMLRTPVPEPPATLVERILTQTSWAHAAAEAAASLGTQPSGATLAHPQDAVPALAAGYAAGATAAGHGNVIPFPRRFLSVVRTSSFGQIMLQPRLAMTAAMAFFSIALTMNLAGIHPLSLRASDLQPSSLARDYHEQKARVARYYEGLRVVYELESRVHDLQSATDNDAAAGAPATTGQPAGQPTGSAPSAQPNPANQKVAPQPSGNQPGGSQPEHAKPAPSPGTSRREDLNQSRRLFAAETAGDRGGLPQARVGRTRV